MPKSLARSRQYTLTTTAAWKTSLLGPDLRSVQSAERRENCSNLLTEKPATRWSCLVRFWIKIDDLELAAQLRGGSIFASDPPRPGTDLRTALEEAVENYEAGIT